MRHLERICNRRGSGLRRIKRSPNDAGCEGMTVKVTRIVQKEGKMPLDHYIPQVHLKHFYSPVLGNRMYATQKSDLRQFTPKSENVCGINDGSTNTYLKEDRSIEEFLKTIEPKYNEALAKLIENKIDEQCIYTISGFVAYVVSCSPAGMRIQSGPLKSSVETVAAMMEARGLIPPPPKELKELGLGGESLVELLDTRAVEVKVDPKFPQAIGINSIRRSLAIFGNFRWDILLNGFNQSPFFTSDFPAAIATAERAALGAHAEQPEAMTKYFPACLKTVGASMLRPMNIRLNFPAGRR